MFSRLYLTFGLLLIVLANTVATFARTQLAQDDPSLGQFAAKQIRHIATTFPGRMAGSDMELATAGYLIQTFTAMGYSADINKFEALYLYTKKEGNKTWQKAPVHSVIANKKGTSSKQIIIMAHFDTYTPMSDDDVEQNLGGPTLQGVDDNASGVGVMLELANRFKDIPTKYSLRFIATSGEELKALGAKHYLQGMTQKERDDTVLVINIDSMITGEHIYFHSGRNTKPAIATISRDRALEIGRRYGIDVAFNPGSKAYPRGTGCCSDYKVFDEAKMPVMAVEASNWSLGERNGYQQRAITASFPQGATWHRPQYDNLEYLEKNLPGRLEQRTRDTVKILLPLLKELAHAAE